MPFLEKFLHRWMPNIHLVSVFLGCSYERIFCTFFSNSNLDFIVKTVNDLDLNLNLMV